jgi:hypothetical protein
MEGVYYVIRETLSGRGYAPHGGSTAPRLYRTYGKAEGRRKQLYSADRYEVVKVQLIAPVLDPVGDTTLQ